MKVFFRWRERTRVMERWLARDGEAYQAVELESEASVFPSSLALSLAKRFGGVVR